MRYREVGKTGVSVSEIGLGGEWLEKQSEEAVREIVDQCEKLGINIFDCWMSEPNVRSNLGKAIKGKRDKWVIQGHIGSTWQNGQYVRTRDVVKCKAAFEDLLQRLQTDYIDFGMIHYIDEVSEWESIQDGEFLRYVRELKREGRIRHIGLSTHNPVVAKMAAQSGVIEMMLFSINPAFDMLPPTENIDDYFADEFDEKLGGIAPERAELYRLCEQLGIGITVMKGFAGGRLFDAKRSPFGVALTPVQCLHYCLTRPAVASVMAGFGNPGHAVAAAAYEDATEEEKDYATALAGAPRHTFSGQCTYCGHCMPCPKHIDIAMVNKLYDLAVMQEQVPESVRSHYHDLKANAGDCIGCGGCETRCPFGVKIAERMKTAAGLFR
ncbi:MAG: aldo/keto reductase [Clostridiales bacterium]|nr:aldo/keto reductase [Clostridiales bacterium]